MVVREITTNTYYIMGGVLAITKTLFWIKSKVSIALNDWGGHCGRLPKRSAPNSERVAVSECLEYCSVRKVNYITKSTIILHFTLH
jgi:hypothetical protein